MQVQGNGKPFVFVPQELHRFLLQDRHGLALTKSTKAQVLRMVMSNLLGVVIPPPVPETQVPAAQPLPGCNVPSLTEHFNAAVSLTGQQPYASKTSAVHPSHVKASAPAGVAATVGTNGITPNLSGWNRKW